MTQKVEEQPKGPTPEQKQDQSRRDRDSASQRKELQEVQRRFTQLEAEHQETVATLTMLREQAQLGENEEERIKALAKREKELTTREKVARDAEKRASARLLHAEYGVPLEDLLEFDSPLEMENAALKWEKAQKPKAEPEEVRPPRVDTGSGTRTAPNWNDFNLNTKEGRAAFDQAAAEQKTNRRR